MSKPNDLTKQGEKIKERTRKDYCQLWIRIRNPNRLEMRQPKEKRLDTAQEPEMYKALRIRCASCPAWNRTWSWPSTSKSLAGKLILRAPIRKVSNKQQALYRIRSKYTELIHAGPNTGFWFDRTCELDEILNKGSAHISTLARTLCISFCVWFITYSILFCIRGSSGVWDLQMCFFFLERSSSKSIYFHNPFFQELSKRN